MLVILGVIMISSVSVYPSFKITSQYVARWLLEEPNNSFYLSRNFLHLTLGIAVLTFFTKLTYTYLEKYHRVALIFVLALMSLVLVVWKELNGAKGWIDIPGLPSIQPVEFAKIGIIIFLAAFIKRKRSLMSSFQEWAVPYFAIVWILFFLLALQPDFGSILILAPLLVGLYFVGWWNPRFIILIFLIATIGAGSVYGFWKLGGDESKSKLSYISKRIDSFFQSSETLFANKVSNQTVTYSNWFLMILRTLIWEIHTKILIPSRSTMRFYIFCFCGGALIYRCICAYYNIPHYYSSWLSDIEMSKRSIWEVSRFWDYDLDSYPGICEYRRKPQCYTTYRCDASFCELWWIITHCPYGWYRNTPQYFEVCRI